MDIIREKSKAFDKSLETTILQSSAQNDANINFSSRFVSHTPYITTITICVYLSRFFPDVQRLLAAYSSTEGVVSDFIDQVLGGKKCFFPNKISSCKNFMNCVIFTMKDDEFTNGKVAIKCFTNGSLHITGVKSTQRAITIAECMCVFFGLVETDESPHVFNIQDFQVQMVNAHFAVDVGEGSISLSKLFENLLKSSQYLCMYNNERHAGVIVKVLTQTMRTLTVIIFESGNVLICAFCDSQEYLEAWNFVLQFLKKHWSSIWTPERLMPHKTNSKRLQGGNGFDYGRYIVLK
jgi:TATA-box binding protein (TBP) (component of TFIID and TFIIIB)